MGGTFKLQRELLKTETNHDEVDGDNYKDKKAEGIDYVKKDVLCTVFSYARYCKAMGEITGFLMKDCLSLPGLGLKYFNSLRTEEHEPIYTYNDKYTRWFVRQSAYGGRVCAFNQNYKSKICDDVLKIISGKLNVKGNVYDIVEAYMNYKNKHFKIFEKEYESNFDHYRDENLEEKESFINNKLGKLPIHKVLQQLSLDSLLWGYDGVSLYLSAMWNEKSIYPKIETGYAFTKDMNDELVEKFNKQTVTRGSVFLRIIY